MKTLVLHPPKLTLVGAGPGDPDLLTVKGLRALQAADVVLYDALACEALLDEAPPTAQRVYVGKRGGQPSMPQARINALIVELANRFGHVVRLKGGDPFVFGRGYEELQHARAHGLQVTVVPGISSAGGLLTALEFPLTHRGLATSFTVLTATTRTGELSPELAAAATTEATLVILMGMHKLPEIARLFAQAGKADLPAAIVYAGSTPSQRIALCPAALLAETARTYELGSPAVLLVGEVVRLHPAYIGHPVLVPQLAPEWAVMLG